ncbi:MAG: hypothetical protein KDJ86_17005 [Bauldia sp.]|uniref:hypothetical protein n=1 Tax=Bauldia sp. TaxID=2575872 RepID=UPI001D3BD35C|nr:hypothetical protein [Bauldia sp.]MCB1497482.1 hypothetical protein [Bauldia sp.]
MPTIARFVTTLAVIAALVAAAMFYLANFVTPRNREMSVRIPSSELEPVPIIKPAPPPEPEPAEEDAGGAAAAE